jgi:glycosyltransferase involved in cell wall biosynthesis
LLGFLGRFMPQKGFIWLLDALHILQKRQTCPHFHLVAYGKGDYIREYKREVAARDGLQERISFMDPVSNVGPVLKQLDVMVMPSRWEACGLLAMEALVLGIPVVGSDCIGLREVLRGTPARTVPVDDVQALADALEMELKSPRRAEFEQYVPEAIRRFDVNRSIEAFDQLVEEVMVH